ncbi:MAG: pentapeptide repeat-containing protein [Fuerstiella sp.]|nr:pentapeptide repeat-containing protein [Fuerstiella sp.]MCP4512820.1 pentapeptide repeat-containing protein [Fuerstiella sp.]
MKAYLWLASFSAIAVVTVNLSLMSSQLRQISRGSQQQAFWALTRPGSTPEARTDYFLRLAASGNSEWRSAILKKLTLADADLSGTNLESASFVSCDFASADLSTGAMNRTGFDLCDLSGADLSESNLRNSSFFKATLVETDFRNADLLSATLEQANARNANFVAARMGDIFLAMTDLTEADLTGADLSGGNLEAAVLKSSDLALANFYDTHLEDTDFTDSNWWRARGFSSQQLDEMILLFAPTPEASESRQRDFEIWLSRRLDESPGSNTGDSE